MAEIAEPVGVAATLTKAPTEWMKDQGSIKLKVTIRIKLPDPSTATVVTECIEAVDEGLNDLRLEVALRFSGRTRELMNIPEMTNLMGALLLWPDIHKSEPKGAGLHDRFAVESISYGSPLTISLVIAAHPYFTWVLGAVLTGALAKVGEILVDGTVKVGSKTWAKNQRTFKPTQPSRDTEKTVTKIVDRFKHNGVTEYEHSVTYERTTTRRK